MFGVDRGRPKIPSDALELEGGTKNVVLFVADGLGYHDVKPRLEDGNFLQAAAASDSLVPITTIFPSTTAAALTTIATGLTPQEHCLPEWFVYMKEIDKVIATLPFAAVGQRGRDALLGEMDPRRLFSGPTINWSLKKRGVDAVCFVGSNIARTAYSKLSHAGSEIVPYLTSSDLFASLRRRLEASKRPTFFYAYWERVDTIGHAYGPGTEESASEVDLLSHVLKKEFLDRLPPKTAEDTTLLLTADHGQIPVEASKTTYLNKMRPVIRNLKVGPSGSRIPPWGSARDVYLAIKEGKIDTTKAALEKQLGGTAAMLPTKEAVARGYFGLGKPRELFLDRVGDLMILPRKRNLVWYRYSRRDDFDLNGHHGGMNPHEMLIPLIVSRVSRLQQAATP